jgi:hypothetical protein
MTRGQRSAHAIVFRVLAVFLLGALGFALSRRHVVREIESAPLGHTAVHELPEGP